MNSEKISSLELIAALSDQSGVTKKTATAFMRQFMTTVEDALLRDGTVKIKGLGTFKIAWNESRTSVNVQTGERYEIAGHNKITFLPDDELRDIVNRPYAHLEAVDIEGNAIEKPEVHHEDEHLKRFSEQATEIMSIISDLQGIQPKEVVQPATTVAPIVEKAIAPEETGVSEKVAETTVKQVVAPAIEEPVMIEQLVVETKEPVLQHEPIAEIPKENIAAVSQSDDEISEARLVERMAAQPVKKSKKWLWITLIIIALLILGAVLCYLFCPYFQTTQKPAAPQIAKTVVAPVAVATKPDTTVKAATYTAPEPAKPVDVFDQPREYKELITTETTTQGSRLTLLALKYYGHKVFWVYIYEANKDKIHNPSVIPVGTKINIPKLDPALIDKHDARSFQKASELQTLYTK
jgi:nucleoid DNA-binding protein